MGEVYRAPPLPSTFIWKRAHSFTGIWLVLFLIEHLFTNSQAALFMGDDGSGFVSAVNTLKSLPYLPLIEIFLLGVPFLIHGWWGVKYLFNSETNSFDTDGSKPALKQFKANQAYTWQRITSWILLFGIVAHVIHMRVIEYPSSAQLGTEHFYMVPVSHDKGLYTLGERLGFMIYNASQIADVQAKLSKQAPPQFTGESETIQESLAAQKFRQEQAWLKAMQKWPLHSNQVLTLSKSFGIAELLMVRNTFKSPLMILLYTGFVLAACFHAFNGLWAAMISWGITLTARSQIGMRKFATVLMILVTLLGLSSIWGTYWFNLHQ